MKYVHENFSLIFIDFFSQRWAFSFWDIPVWKIKCLFKINSRTKMYVLCKNWSGSKIVQDFLHNENMFCIKMCHTPQVFCSYLSLQFLNCTIIVSLSILLTWLKRAIVLLSKQSNPGGQLRYGWVCIWATSVYIY